MDQGRTEGTKRRDRRLWRMKKLEGGQEEGQERRMKNLAGEAKRKAWV